MNVDDEREILAGFVPCRPVPRLSWMDPRVVPTPLVTISDCLEETPRPEFWAWYTTRGAAERARAESCPDGRLLAVGLRTTDARELAERLRESSGYAQSIWRGEPTPYGLLTAAEPVPTAGRGLGFDVVGLEWAVSSVHSWLCHSYETEVRHELGVRLNSLGLLETHEDASAVLAHLDGQPPENAPEPAFWTVVSLTECAPGRPERSAR
ncbi:hypothetical protein H3146_03490 [Streptomyces sp. OF3]|uniref:Uncharacterized protein n=1 Tax=Streptomyces alkaliterrae TaxID=2213162 RepID=A0A7W3WHF7_9ACTN|nr:hypothetical protein [Streptomyces alkaliterrae]MBB1252438.1 hypothetical protein [Streptomyces alkaliterrae]